MESGETELADARAFCENPEADFFLADRTESV